MRLLLILATLFVSTVVSAQNRPIFTPITPAPTKAPTETKEGEPSSPQEVPSVTEPDPVAEQFVKLRKWPSKVAKEAAYVLSGLGQAVEPRLISGLTDNDWRVRAGCATALGEMGAKGAVPALVSAIRDPSNRAGLSVLMRVLSRLDPEGATEVLLPYLAHDSVSVRKDAADALPRVLSDSYLPQALELLRSRRAPIRAQAIDLLFRTPSGRTRPEIYQSLGDPDPRVADAAARHLATLGTQESRDLLLEAARTAPARRGAYAMLALIRDEDRDRAVIIPSDATIRDRALALIRSEDPFYRGTAAVVLANLSFRSEEEGLRRLADRYLVPILLRCVAGGVFFSDYRSLQDLCFEKMEMLSGQKFGSDARSWETWWDAEGQTFAARRELRGLTESDLKRVTVRLRQRLPDGTEESVALSGDESALVMADPLAPLVMGDGALARLRSVLNDSGFFSDRGEQPTEALPPDQPFTDVTVLVGVQEFHRFHAGPAPESLHPLIAFVKEAAVSLAWQRFVPAGIPDRRRAFLASERAFFEGSPDEESRTRRMRELGIASYKELPRSGRRLAVALLSKAPESWIATRRGDLLLLLKDEKRLNDEALVLIDLLATAEDPEVQSVVLDVVSRAPGHAGDEVLSRFLSRRSYGAVTPLMSDERARVRAAAALALPKVGSQDAVATLLIAGLKDYDGTVREACLKSLSTLEDRRVLALLETVIAGDDEALRLRAISALGRVLGEQAVTRIGDIYRDGDRRTRYAAIRALRDSGGRGAVVALAGIVRETGELELRREAAAAMVGLGGQDAADRLLDILSRSKEPQIRRLLIGSVADILGNAATPSIEPLLTDDDPEVRRIAALTLGRIGAPSALVPLLDLMDGIEGDEPAERSFEALTFFRSDEKSPAKRLIAYRNWQKSYGELSRREWFLLAAQRTGAGLDPELDWINPVVTDGARLAPLLRVVERGNPSVRAQAEQWLLLGTGLSMRPLDASASEKEVADRVARYREMAILAQ